MKLDLVREKMTEKGGTVRRFEEDGKMRTRYAHMIALLPGIAWVSVEVHDIETSSE